ncbi:hypothetical protein AX768_08505 [Burkholderia sp. PAMC 28687]|nr:hypothetical protein AX768_08505 [Burkholderia sp. PAMC 28687]
MRTMVPVAKSASAQAKSEAAINQAAPKVVAVPPRATWFATRKSTFAALCLFGLQPLLIDVAHAQATLSKAV